MNVSELVKELFSLEGTVMDKHVQVYLDGDLYEIMGIDQLFDGPDRKTHSIHINITQPIKKTWFEVGVTFDDGGTESVYSNDTLEDAKEFVDYAIANGECARSVVNMFIDKWEYDSGINRKAETFLPIVIEVKQG